MRWLVALTLALMMMPVAASAQRSGDYQDLTTGAGDPDGALLDKRMSGEEMIVTARLQRDATMHRDKACSTLGCLIIVNQTRDFDIVGMYLDIGKPENHASPTWGRNQLQFTRLNPGKAMFAYKSGNASMCQLPVRLELRGRRTAEKLNVDDIVDLCKQPATFSVLRVRVATPNVTVEP